MSNYSDYEPYRQKFYSGDGYQPDSYWGGLLNDLERSWMDQKMEGVDWQGDMPDPQTVSSWLEHDSTVEGGGVGRLRFDHPVVDNYAQVAYMRTNDHFRNWREGPVYPEDPTILDKFPGIDPKGTYCVGDMSNAQRLTTIQYAAAWANPQRQAVLNSAIEALRQSGGLLRDMLEGAQDMFKAVREAQHAAKVGPIPMVRGLMDKGAQGLIAQSEYVRKLDCYYSALEHIAGLRQGQPSQEILEVAGEFNLPLFLVVQPARPVPISTMNIEFQNFDHMVQQRTFSHPLNWGRHPDQLPPEPGNPVALSGYVSQSVTATVNTALSAMYAGVGNQTEGPQGRNPGTLIVVDGMTPEERMADEYQKLPPPKPVYDLWYARFVGEKTNEYAAAALMTGKRVEAYIPDEKGELPEEPVRLVAGGYTPSAEKPVTLNAGEQFVSRVGFDKEKLPPAKTDRQSLEARDRVQAHYTASQIADMNLNQKKFEEMFFGAYLREIGKVNLAEFADSLNSENGLVQICGENDSYISVCCAACFAIMAAQGATVEAIMNPAAMKEDKQRVGKMLLERLSMDPKTGRPGVTKESRVGDPEWLGRMYFAGQQAVLNQVEEQMQGVDVRDPSQMRHVMPALSACEQVLDRTFRDAAAPAVYESYKKMAEYRVPGRGEDAAKVQMKKVAEVASTLRAITEGYQSRTAIATCEDGQIGAHLQSCLQESIYLDRLAQTPGKRFVDRIPNQKVCQAISRGLAESESIKSLAKSISESQDARRAVSQMAQSGRLAKEVDMRLKPDGTGAMKVEVKPFTRMLEASSPAALDGNHISKQSQRVR